ncbi:DUF3570 domain-containing protein [Paraglaciecola sp.]|uniref:DUF3570 domain-containing protein n=1 Tax=Paraglaciecola sp. TaxID=1920173 RepID=UPI003EF32BAB
MVVIRQFVRLTASIAVFATVISAGIVQAAVLPQDRSDALYHSYEGDGVSIDGPSILLRKKIGDKVSLSANYYVDSISGASIDVRATASEYIEERTETTLGADFLHNKSIFSVSFTASDENDFKARSMYLGLSQDFFGDLTTLSLSYSRGQDEIGKTGDESFLEEADRQKYGLGITQVATKNLIMGLTLENISDTGYLNNPYRSVRFLDPNAARGYRFVTEIYPKSRTSNALALTANYYLAHRASVYGEARGYKDSWGIQGQNIKLGYVHTFGDDWIVDVRSRFYSQDKADFYQDLFTRENQFNFMARDKELSTFSNVSVGLSVSYEKSLQSSSIFKKWSVNGEVEHIRFDYEDFRDVLAEGPVGEEPLFAFNANVIRLFVSVWY